MKGQPNRPLLKGEEILFEAINESFRQYVTAKCGNVWKENTFSVTSTADELESALSTRRLLIEQLVDRLEGDSSSEDGVITGHRFIKEDDDLTRGVPLPD